MKNPIRLTLLILVTCISLSSAQPEFPQPRGFVNDFADVIDPATERRIESFAVELKQKTGAELVLVTIRSLEGESIEGYTNLLFEKWGIGEKGKDNGVLFLDAVQDRRMRIEVGYGFEGILPDGKVGSIRDQFIIPYLSRNDRDSGYLYGMTALASEIAADAGVTLSGVPQRVSRPVSQTNNRGIGSIIPIIFFILLMLVLGRRRGGLWWLFPMMFLGGGGRSSGWGGGGFGGFGGGFGGFGGGFSGGGGASGSY
jgi:uncharacterized protein